MPARNLETEVLINASPAKVWNIISDTESYEDWNPFITKVTGVMAPGRRLRVILKPPKGMAFTFRPYVETLDRPNELSWLGRLFFAPIFQGRHYMRIESQGEGVVRFVHGEDFSGILLPLIWKSLNTNTRAGFELMNAKVKELAEA